MLLDAGRSLIQTGNFPITHFLAFAADLFVLLCLRADLLFLLVLILYLCTCVLMVTWDWEGYFSARLVLPVTRQQTDDSIT